MVRVVGVHGMGQEVKGPDDLAMQVWAPALRSGVRLAGGPLPEPDEVAVAFYGDLFRKPGSKALGVPQYAAVDVEEGSEQDLLQAWWEQAALTDPAVPGPEEPTKLRTPLLVQRALNALSQSQFFAELGEHLIIGMIKQVHAYLTDERVRAAVQARVAAAMRDDTRVLVGHSLGSVVAYEAVCAHPEWPISLVTLGCPLGIRNIVFDRLRPAPVEDRGVFPAGVRGWTNVADRGDVVALVKQLRPLFGDRLVDRSVNNGAKAHDVSPYLTAVETGQAITAGLSDQ
jgi:hypothetical protein